MAEAQALYDESHSLSFFYLEPLEEDEADEIEYLTGRNRELRDHVRRLEDIVAGTYNRRLLTQNNEMRGKIVSLEMDLQTAKLLKEKAQRKERGWERNYDRLKVELNDLMKEAAFMYNETREDGDPELSADEMMAYLMSRREEGGSVPHAMLRCDESPMQVHERLRQMGIMQSKKRDAESSAEFWARHKSQDEYAATVAQRRQT